MEREKIFFENKGLSSTMKGYLLVFSIIWVGITVLQIMLFLDLFRDVSETNGSNFFQAVHGVFVKLNILDILGFLYAVVLGSFYSAFSIAGSKLSMKIYESHIEGRAAVGTKIKDVYIPIEEVYSLATVRGYMLSSIYSADKGRL